MTFKTVYMYTCTDIVTHDSPLRRLSICSSIMSFCFWKSSEPMAPISNKEWSSLICLMYVDLSSAALTGVKAVETLWGDDASAVWIDFSLLSPLTLDPLKNEPLGGFSRSWCLPATIVSDHTRYWREVNLDPCFSRNSSTVSSTRSVFCSSTVLRLFFCCLFSSSDSELSRDFLFLNVVLVWPLHHNVATLHCMISIKSCKSASFLIHIRLFPWK